ncbi:Plus3 domain-containing protein [Abeliophyllum distichum]|uniref:Plus3 domain-containing protein n=1 Tax=Abeliophyllum distichum TaxID=126358 RepID=A0ABD1SBE5_9LAMI
MPVDSVHKWERGLPNRVVEKDCREKGDGRWVPEMRGSLDKRDASAAKALDDELRRLAIEASMARSRITAGELEDIWQSYDISAAVTLRALGLEEHVYDPPEGFVAIHEPAMQQGLRLPMHNFFHDILRDWNLAPCQITLNGWQQMVASYLLWVVANAGGNLTSREFESIYQPC